MFETADGWAFLGCRPASLPDVAALLGSADATLASLASVLKPLTIDAARRALARITDASIVPVTSLEKLRKAHSLPLSPDEVYRIEAVSAPVVEAPHPSGHATTLPIPSWNRWGSGTTRRPAPAPMPGTHTLSVLAEHGLDAAKLHKLLDDGVIRERWAVHQRYFPL
jgi:crotonobetainyl-CoA:carnitine CoA-transferase CaiB-like acyl-CoA transferase